jgi:hypothetical protein
MSWRRVVLLVISLLLSVSAYASDWRVYGQNIDKDEIVLYSASDLARDGSKVRVWTETINGKDVTAFLEANKEHPEQIAQKVAGRVKAGYKPPYAVTNNFNADTTFAVAVMEQAADEGGAPAKSRALYEFDCAGGRLRILQFTSLEPGQEGTITVPQPWQYIAPDTVGATLKSWVCKRS